MLEMLELWEKCGMIGVLIDMCSRAMYHFRGRCGFPRNLLFVYDGFDPSKVRWPAAPNVTSRLLAWRFHLSGCANHGSVRDIFWLATRSGQQENECRSANRVRGTLTGHRRIRKISPSR